MAKKKDLRHFISFTLILISSLPLAYGQKGRIVGKVKDSLGVLPAATVVAGNVTVLTDINGDFSVSLNPGRYTLVITHVGFEKFMQEAIVSSGARLSLDINMKATEKVGEVVVLGSRSLKPRTNLETPVPVDVFYSRQLIETGQPSLTQMLQFAVPSLNASRPLIVEPVTLRGLDPDQVLILVNGVRRHGMAYITPGGVRGLLGAGAVANDLNGIPFSAIEKIEVLRDGAAAQYGSDAIAGVMNIQLKKNTGKTSLVAQGGQYYKGDGKSITIGVNSGVALIEKGFLNVSADFRRNNPTYRGGQYNGTVYTENKKLDDSIVSARAFDRNRVSNAGSSEHTGGGVLMNGGYPVGKKTDLFWMAAVNISSTIFHNGYLFPKFSNRINPELFPDGIMALPHQSSTDLSLIAGAKGETESKWLWEYRSAYGTNVNRGHVNNTNNASQYYTEGKNAPTSFYTGTLYYRQLTNNFHVSKFVYRNSESMLNLALGAEWRREDFQMTEGEEASWNNYDPYGRKQGGTAGGLVISPKSAVNANRDIGAMYVDIESEFADRFLFDLAGRYEYFNDCGGNLAGKIAARYKFSDKFMIRASLNNGFRAPSVQQRYYSLTNSITLAPFAGVLAPVSTGLFQNDSEPSKALGIPSLQAETSVNAGGGLTAILMKRIHLSVDAYWIQIRNRIVLSGSFDRRINRDVDSLLRNITDVNQLQFFANAINTRTKGLDMVINANWKIGRARLITTLAANFTRTRLSGEIKTAGHLRPDSLNTNTLFGRLERGRLETGQPDSKIIFSLQYQTKRFALSLRNTRFGKTLIVFESADKTRDQLFAPKILTDFSIQYTPKSWIAVTAGVNNVFNVYPDRIKNYLNTQEGMYVYAQETTSFGFYGGYYFLQIVMRL